MERFLKELKKKKERECQTIEDTFKNASTFEGAFDTLLSVMRAQFETEINDYEKLWHRKKEESIKIFNECFEKTINKIQVENEKNILDCENKTYNIEYKLYPCLQRKDFPDKVKMKEIEHFFIKMNEGIKEYVKNTFDDENINVPNITFSKNKFLNEIKDGLIPQKQIREEKSSVVRYTREQIIYCTISQILLNICTIEEKDVFLKTCIKNKNIPIYDIYCELIKSINFQYYGAKKMLEEQQIESMLQGMTEWDELSRMQSILYGQVLGTKIAYDNILKKAKKIMED